MTKHLVAQGQIFDFGVISYAVSLETTTKSIVSPRSVFHGRFTVVLFVCTAVNDVTAAFQHAVANSGTTQYRRTATSSSHFHGIRCTIPSHGGVRMMGDEYRTVVI